MASILLVIYKVGEILEGREASEYVKASLIMRRTIARYTKVGTFRTVRNRHTERTIEFLTYNTNVGTFPTCHGSTRRVRAFQ